jgi:ankyrin repeat protein
MQGIDPNVLSVIASYIPSESFDALEEVIPGKMKIVSNNPIFWKLKTEILMGKQLKDRFINWETTYKNLLQAIEKNDIWYPVSLGDINTVLIIMELDYDPSINNDKALIYAIQSKNLKMLKLILSDQRVNIIKNGYMALQEAIYDSNFDMVEYLLKYTEIDPSANNNSAIYTLAGNIAQNPIDRENNIKIARLLLEDPRVNPSEALSMAVHTGNIDIINLLLENKRVDPSNNNNSLIIRASSKGYFNVVKKLLLDPRVDPSANGNSALRSASRHDHYDIVKLLMSDPRVDPSAYNNEAIKSAAYEGNYDIVKLLMTDPRVNPKVAIGTASYAGHQDIVNLLLGG